MMVLQALATRINVNLSFRATKYTISSMTCCGPEDVGIVSSGALVGPPCERGVVSGGSLDVTGLGGAFFFCES